MTKAQVDKRLKQIAKAIKDGQDPEDFQEEMDRLLGTEMEERDREAEIAWENEYQNLEDL